MILSRWLARARGERVARPDSLVIQAQLENGALLYWRLGADGSCAKIEEPQAGNIVSFCQDDVRIRAPRALGIEAAKSFATRESESLEALRVINRSREGVIYATPDSRVERDRAFAICPGLLVLDALAREPEWAPPMVCGFLFGAEPASVAVLYAISAGGRATLSVSVNPDNLDSVVTLFGAQAKLPDEHRTVVFTQDEFFDAVSRCGLPHYPSEREWAGIPLSRIRRTAAVMSVVTLAGSAAWAGLGAQQADATARARAKVDAETAARTRAIGGAIAQRPTAIAAMLGIDVGAGIAEAERLWLPGAKVDTRLSTQVAEHRVTMPFGRPTTGSLVSPFAATPAGQIQALIDVELPPGCDRDAVSVSGGVNEIQLAVRCVRAHNDLAGLRRR